MLLLLYLRACAANRVPMGSEDARFKVRGVEEWGEVPNWDTATTVTLLLELEGGVVMVVVEHSPAAEKYATRLGREKPEGKV